MINLVLTLAYFSFLGFTYFKMGIIGVAGIIVLCGIINLIAR